jgi:hypothetical protein
VRTVLAVPNVSERRTYRPDQVTLKFGGVEFKGQLLGSFVFPDRPSKRELREIRKRRRREARAALPDKLTLRRQRKTRRWGDARAWVFNYPRHDRIYYSVPASVARYIDCGGAVVGFAPDGRRGHVLHVEVPLNPRERIRATRRRRKRSTGW